MVNDERLKYFKDRKVVLASSERIYVVPEPLWELDPRNVDETLALDNVWRGIQWYKAYCMEGYDGLEDGARVDLLLKIFDTPNLVTLAKFVELQTGVRGVTESILKSFTWAEWKLFPGPHDVGEAIFSKPNLSFSATTGERGADTMIVSIRQFGKDPETKIFKGRVEWEDGEFDYLPEFKVEEVRVLNNRRIAFEGLPVDELDQHNKLKKYYDSYILGNDGGLEVDTREKYDREYIFERFMANENDPHIIPDGYFGKEFDREGITGLLSKQLYADRALATFLLPYCDEPSMRGIHYILPE